MVMCKADHKGPYQGDGYWFVVKEWKRGCEDRKKDVSGKNNLRRPGLMVV